MLSMIIVLMLIWVFIFFWLLVWRSTGNDWWWCSLIIPFCTYIFSISLSVSHFVNKTLAFTESMDLTVYTVLLRHLIKAGLSFWCGFGGRGIKLVSRLIFTAQFFITFCYSLLHVKLSYGNDTPMSIFHEGIHADADIFMIFQKVKITWVHLALSSELSTGFLFPT